MKYRPQVLGESMISLPQSGFNSAAPPHEPTEFERETATTTPIKRATSSMSISTRDTSRLRTSILVFGVITLQTLSASAQAQEDREAEPSAARSTDAEAAPAASEETDVANEDTDAADPEAADADAADSNAKAPSAVEDTTATPEEAPATAAQVEALREEVHALHLSLAQVNQEIEEKNAAEKALAESPTPLEKGNFYLGGTLGWTYRGRDQVGTLFGTVDDGHRLKTRVEGVFGRVLKTNSFAVGMTVAYEHASNKGNFTDPDTGVTDNRQTTEYNLEAGPAIRGFFPLGSSNKLFIYGQAGLYMGYAERVSRVTGDTTSSVADANGYTLALAVQPGIMLAASKNFAIEMGINLLGIDYQRFKTTTDYDVVGLEQNASLTVDVNLLSLQFAFVGYF